MTAIWTRINTVLLLLALLALLAVIGMLATGVRGGPLDPPAPPAPTGKTLEEIPGSWNRKLPADDGGAGPPVGCDSTRFRCGQLGILDRETGLVWSYETSNVAVDWANARGTCLTIQTGGRRGWRLPTMEELQSLVDLFVDSPTLPPGNPFTVLIDDHYWTSTSASSTAAFAYRFDNLILADAKVNTNYFWCVRGGQAYDGPS